LRILVTGASGFIGRSLCNSLRNVHVIKPCRNSWSEELAGVDCIIHLASIVHQNNFFGKTSMSRYREINVKKTLDLANKAISADVKRFIFVSSISVNGNFTRDNSKFNPNDTPNPQSFYAVSKLEAEIGLKDLIKKSSMELVIVRPPLVYGPGVKANFHSLMSYLQKGLPVPKTHSLKSMIYIENLVDLLIKLIDHPKAVGETFLVSDKDDIDLSELFIDIAKEFGSVPRFIHLPQNLTVFFLKVFGQKYLVNTLFQSLQVDSKKTEQLLNWTPPFKYPHGLKKTVQAFVAQVKK
jgi:nucleoside-diphosphate-sugar epimerase